MLSELADDLEADAVDSYLTCEDLPSTVVEPTRVELTPGSNTEQLRLKTGAMGDADTVLFEAIDADSRETIARRESVIDMIIRDGVGFDV